MAVSDIACTQRTVAHLSISLSLSLSLSQVRFREQSANLFLGLKGLYSKTSIDIRASSILTLHHSPYTSNFTSSSISCVYRSVFDYRSRNLRIVYFSYELGFSILYTPYVYPCVCLLLIGVSIGGNAVKSG